MLESKFDLIRIIYFVNLLLSFAFILTYGITFDQFLIVAAVFFFMNPLGIAISYHRYWSHKSFEWKNKLLMLMCTLPPMISCVGSVLGWVGIHRLHHEHSDTELDPHRASKGYFNMLFMNSYDYTPRPKYIIDLMRDKFVVFTHKYYFAFPLLYVLLVGLLFGFPGIVLGFCMPAALSLVTQNTTNFVNHYVDEKFSPGNVGWINMFNFGDGWHKNHHDNPRSYTTQKEWWQIDPAGWMIKYVFAKKSSLSYSQET